MKMIGSTSSSSSFRGGWLAAALGASLAPLLACGVVEDAPASEAQAEAPTASPIIGGSSVSIPTQRSIGLVTVNDACSGLLISKDWVLTAAHCAASYTTPGLSTVTMPRADLTTLERRTVLAISRVGASDLALMKLVPTTSTTWPSVANTMASTIPAIGAALTCYGRGATAYATGGGTTGAGWRSLSTTVANVVNGNLVTNANSSGSQVGAPGDSGGPCFVGSQVVGVGSFDEIASCNDPTTPTTCALTVTKFSATDWRSTAEFKNYIDTAPSRSASTATFAELGATDSAGGFPNLSNGWFNHPYGTNDAQASLILSTVHLRGGTETFGTSPVLFTLPSNMFPSADIYVPTNLCGAAKGRLYINTQGVVTVQEENGDFAKAQCFTSLEGVSFAVNGSNTTVLQPINGWSNAPYNTRPPAVRVVDGVVRFQGAIYGTSTAGANPFQPLASAFRPVGRKVYLSGDLCNVTKGRILVDTNGTVTLSTYGPFDDARCFTSLEGLSYTIGTGSILQPQNGWTFADANLNTSSPTATNVDGIIRFAGAMKTTGTNATALQLPANMRPATAVYVPVELSGAQKGRLLIQPSGWIDVQVPSNVAFGVAGAFTSLEGASFGL